MKLTTANLERLAKLYSVLPAQLLVAPDMAELVGRLDEVQTILSGMKPEDATRWLDIGRSLSKAPTTK